MMAVCLGPAHVAVPAYTVLTDLPALLTGCMAAFWAGSAPVTLQAKLYGGLLQGYQPLRPPRPQPPLQCRHLRCLWCRRLSQAPRLQSSRPASLLPQHLVRLHFIPQDPSTLCLSTIYGAELPCHSKRSQGNTD